MIKIKSKYRYPNVIHRLDCDKLEECQDLILSNPNIPKGHTWEAFDEKGNLLGYALNIAKYTVDYYALKIKTEVLRHEPVLTNPDSERLCLAFAEGNHSTRKEAYARAKTIAESKLDAMEAQLRALPFKMKYTFMCVEGGTYGSDDEHMYISTTIDGFRFNRRLDDY